MTRRGKIAFFCSLLLMVGLVFLFRPSPQYDPARLATPLAEIKEPLRLVRLQVYMDGGSVAMELMDREGKIVSCVLPVSSTNPATWNRVLLGSMNPRAATLVEAEFPEDNKAFLVRMADRYAVRDAAKIDVLIRLRGFARDYISGYLYAKGL